MALFTTTAALTAKARLVQKYWKWALAAGVSGVGVVAFVAVLSLVAIESAKTAPSEVALADIAPVALEAYVAAGDHCNGLTWNILAGIGKVESNHGRVFGGQIDGAGDVVPPIFGAALNGSGAGGNTTPWPAGQWEGQWGLTGPWLRALGPMQFISPSWAAFGQDGNGDGTQNPHNIFDGARSAAQLLCESQGGEITNLTDALFSYNRSTEYGQLVLHWSRLYVALPFGAFDGTAQDLLHHPNVELHPRARGDLEAGVVDPRLISALVTAADDFTMYIGWFKSGHSECVGGGSIAQRPGCTISNHHFGRAADIGAVGFADQADRPLVRPNNDAARALTTRWGTMSLDDPLRPESIGSPWDTGVFHGHFTDGNHVNHLHVAWRTDPPPPEAIDATRHGLDDVDVFPSPPANDFFLPVVLPLRANEIEVGPNDVQAAIDNAAPSTRIVLAPGFYPPIRVRDAEGISIVGSPDGVATISSGVMDRNAGILVENSSNVTISGLSLTDSLWGIQVWDSTNVTIAGNTISRLGQEAIHVGDNSSDVTIQNNSISHTGQRRGVDEEQGVPFRTFGEGIYIGTGRPAGVDLTNNVRIIGNEISHTSAEAIELKPGVFDVAVERNIIHDTSTQTKGAIVVHVGEVASNDAGISIRRNIIWNTTRTSEFEDGNGIVVSGPAHVQANIIWDSQHRGVLVQEVYGPERDVTVRRNVIFDSGLDDVDVWDHSPPLTTLTQADNIDGTVLGHDAFVGGWINNDRPTEALALLLSALDDDTVPINDLASVFAPRAANFPAFDGVNLRRPGDWPIRNVNLDDRTQFLDTPASELEWGQFTEPSDRAIQLGPVTPTKLLGQFRTQCSFSHFAYDDPLVFPGEFGAAHLHMFFGNTLADANSTGGSIRDTGSSTCNGFEGNRSGYWIPAVFDGQGDARIPSRIEVYYKTHSNQAANAIQPPLGLGIIAGTAATNREIEWACQETGAQGQNLNRPIQQRQNTIPRCSNTATLLAHIKFPQCLANPDSISPNGTNGTAQLSYPAGGFFFGNCAAGTQYITAIEFFIAWAPNDHDGRTDEWWLSSDVNPQTGERAPNGSTLHGDWFNGWNPALMDEIFENCIGRLAECSWDLVQSNRRLIQIEHFGRTHNAAYSGPREIPASDVSSLLCPGDGFTTANDVAYCESREVGYGPSGTVPEPARTAATATNAGCRSDCTQVGFQDLRNQTNVTLENLIISNPNGRCMDLSGAQDITLRSVTIRNCGTSNAVDGGYDAGLIQIDHASNITITNSLIEEMSAERFGASRNNAVQIHSSNNVSITNSSIRNVRSDIGDKADDRGNRAIKVGGSTSQITISGNHFFNAGRNAVQLVTVRDAAGISIAENVIEGRGRWDSDYEDMINLFSSSGIPGSPIRISNNLLRNGGPSTTGTGMILGDGNPAAGSTQFVVAEGNVLIDPGHVGINLAGGTNITVRNNTIVGTGDVPHDTTVGLAINDFGYSVECRDHVVSGNLVWMENQHVEGGVNHAWIPGTCNTNVTLLNNSFGDRSVLGVEPISLRSDDLSGSAASSFGSVGFVEPVWTGSIDGEAVVPVSFRSDRDLISEPPRRRRDVDGDDGVTVGGSDPLHFCSLLAPGTWEPTT